MACWMISAVIVPDFGPMTSSYMKKYKKRERREKKEKKEKKEKQKKGKKKG